MSGRVAAIMSGAVANHNRASLPLAISVGVPIRAQQNTGEIRRRFVRVTGEDGEGVYRHS